VTGAEHANTTAYRRTADAFRARDFDTLRTLIAEDVVWHVPGRHRLAGDIRGIDDLVEWLSAVTALGFWLTEHDVLGNDEHVVALSEMGARRPGFEVQTRVTSVFHYRAGRQVERWFHPEDAAAWDAIFDA
jgi:ketosteroid isomerase-like protein